MITLVTGGARSGKSTYAENICANSHNVIYIACGVITDKEMEHRVKLHKLQRPDSWYTLEAYQDIPKKLQSLDEYTDVQYVLLDCITTMITNLMMDSNVDYDTCSLDDANAVERSIVDRISNILDLFSESNKHLVLVSNEVGLGLVPAYRMGRIFRDIAGRANQLIASRADNVYMTVSGILIKIK